MEKIIRKIKCPCCGNYSIEDRGEEVVVDICPICFWQFDIVGHEKETISIGPNKVSLIEARENYKDFGASEARFIEYVRKPESDE